MIDGTSTAGTNIIYVTVEGSTSLSVQYGLTPALGQTNSNGMCCSATSFGPSYAFYLVVDPCSNYYYSAVASNTAGTTTSPVGTFDTITQSCYDQAPNPPSNVSAVAGDDEATISFTPGAPLAGNMNRGDLTYCVQILMGSSSSPQSLCSPTSPIVITGLLNGRTFGFSVMALEINGGAQSSAAVEANTVTPMAASPPTPAGGSGPPTPSTGVTAPTTPTNTSTTPASTSVLPAPQTGSSSASTGAPTFGSSGLAAAITAVSAKPVALGSQGPALALTLSVSKPSQVLITLIDSKGRAVATWTKRAAAGKDKLTLTIPSKARRKGVYTVRIALHGGGRVKTIPVRLVA